MRPLYRLTSGYFRAGGRLPIAAVALLVVQLLVIVMLADTPDRFMAGDSASYVAPARELVAARAFRATSVADLVESEVRRTPGYPILLAALFATVGESPTAVVAVQAVVRTLATLLLGLFVARHVSLRAGYVAFGFLAIDPVGTANTFKLLSETLFAALFTGALLLLVVALRRARCMWPAVMGAVLLVAATYVRPVTLYAFVPVALVLVAADWKRPLSVAVLRRGAAFAGIFLVGVVPWVARNRVQSGYTGFAAIQSVNLLYFRAAAVVAATEGTTLEAVQRRMGYAQTRAQHPEWAGLSQGQIYADMERRGAQIVLAHPVLAARGAAVGALTMLLAPGTNALIRLARGDLSVTDVRPEPQRGVGAFAKSALTSRLPATIVTLFGGLFLSLLYILATRGWLILRQTDPCVAWGLMVVAVYLIVVSAGPEANSRFRLPLMPIFAGVAAVGSVRRRA